MSDPVVEKSPLQQQEIAQSFTLEMDGQKVVVKMVFGKLNRICAIVGDLSNVQQLMVNPDVAAMVVAELLSTKDKRLTIADLEDLDISPDQSAELVTWASTHVLDFFIKLGEKFSKAATPLLSKMQNVAEESAKVALEATTASGQTS